MNKKTFIPEINALLDKYLAMKEGKYPQNALLVKKDEQMKLCLYELQIASNYANEIFA